jgi:hypothetical protein
MSYALARIVKIGCEYDASKLEGSFQVESLPQIFRRSVAR